MNDEGQPEWTSSTCEGACVNGECKGCNTINSQICDANVLKTCNSNYEYDLEFCEYGCENNACRTCVENSLGCAGDGIVVTICKDNQYVKTSTSCPEGCYNGECSDKNGNHLKDDYEPNYETAQECIKHSECTSNFCDSLIGKCSVKCTDSSQCVGDYVCRSDGRCAPDFFGTIWRTKSNNEKVEIPTAKQKSCSFKIDWGDGSEVQEFKTCPNPNLSHVYANSGNHYINITGDIVWSMGSKTESYMETGMAAKLIEVRSYGLVRLAPGAFANATYLKSLPTDDIPNSDGLTDMTDMFYLAADLVKGLSKWDVSNVKYFNNTFDRAVDYNDNLSRWNTSNAVSFSEMFKDSGFNGDISAWDVSNVESMNGMFQGAKYFNKSISDWKVSKVKSMNSMFRDAVKFDQPIGTWNTSNVTNMSYMFAKSRFNQPIGSWKTSKVANMSYMFSENLSFNMDLGGWDVSNVNDMRGMFNNAESFNHSGIIKWKDKLHSVNMSKMFYSADEFNQPIGDWDVSSVTDMSEMFSGASEFQQLLIKWQPTTIINSKDCSKLTDIFKNTKLTAANVKMILIYWNLKGVCSVNGLCGLTGE